MRTAYRFRVGIVSGCVAVGVVLTDRITKQFVIRTLDVHESVPVIKGLFSLTHLQNRAGVFGLGPENPMVFTIASVIALLFVGYLFRTLEPRQRAQHIALGLILGGAVGNLVDRLFCGESLFGGAVTDFLDFYIGEHHWPPFNIADSAITVGVAVFLVSAFLGSRREVHDASGHP